MCAYIKNDPKVIHTNFLLIKRVLLLCSYICACDNGFSLWTRSPDGAVGRSSLEVGQTHNASVRLAAGLFTYLWFN